MADSAVLRKQRAMIKGACTRVKTYVDSIASVTPSVMAQLEERKQKLEGYWSDYDKVQFQLEIIDEGETNDRAVFEEAFFCLSARIREALNPPLITSRDVAAPSPSTSNASGNAESTHMRLPKLSLPTFSEKYHEWFPFYDAFNSIIHMSATLSNVQRLQYLRASLTGDASDIISSLEISDRNYDIAWSMLKKRYDNKRVIVHAHIKAIMELPSMVRENAFELRQIADGASKHIHALQALKRPTEYWDDLLVYVIASKLDTLTLREWQGSLTGSEIPMFSRLVDFVAHRCQVLEATGRAGACAVKAVNARALANGKRQSACAATLKFKCSYCKGNHSVYHCREFLDLSISRRVAEMRRLKTCLNCLRSVTHTANKCPAGSCRTCKAKHNTLHPATPSEGHDDDQSKSEKSSAAPATTVAHVSCPHDGNFAMLSTAVVYVYDNLGVPCRVLLDCGSQANFVSKRFMSALNLKPRSLNISIAGVGGAIARSTQTIVLRMQSRLSEFSFHLDCVVTEQVTGRLPSFTLKRGRFEFPRNLPLADPHFYRSSEVDALIGADLFWDLICVGQVKASQTHPTLQKTRLGWILAGRFGNPPKSGQQIQAYHTTITNAQLHEQLSRFWQQEDVAGRPVNYTLDEERCEKHFQANVTQSRCGRYIVKLPIKEQVITKLGGSKDVALKSLQALERRLIREPLLKSHYVHFMDEYLALGHMRVVDVPHDDQTKSYYLPHHCVIKSSKQSFKLRVVFDASCKTSAGLSLNDALMVGPVVQQDLMSILMRFRTLRYVITADVVKMYRQILVDPSQTPLQRILWRSEGETDVKTYELLTVTYGTASASYLATRCLQHLAERCENEYPAGSRSNKRDFYVDDLLTGADTIEEAKQTRDEVIQVLQRGAFELSKWASNSRELLQDIGEQGNRMITINDDPTARILGVEWDQSRDVFRISHDTRENRDVVSKRTILSGIARLFDPLGLLGPVIVTAKLVLQELWQSGTHWDESVPQETHARWSRLEEQLPELKLLRIPRCVKFTTNPQALQMHGFCDASQQAYGACIYIRTRIGTKQYRTELLCSRSRVAPLKAISLPRLELSAALLLARLLDKVRTSFELAHMEVFLWSDSTITLNWIASTSRRWEVFVANRIGEIQRLTKIKDWQHIASSDNPADILSRGLYPCELAHANLWWHGPAFLQNDKEHWPSNNVDPIEEELPEKRKIAATAVVFDSFTVDNLLEKHSSLNKVYRIMAYCLRFRKKHRPPEMTAFVTPGELANAREIACIMIQRAAFPGEYKALSKGDSISSSSRLLPLSPFKDDKGLLRVGGRLKNSGLQFDTCHPIVLPRDHKLTKRIIEQEHARNLHAGTQATMAAVRQRYWSLSLRSVARKIIRNCVICFKARPSHSEALMASLPASRVTVSRPFLQCGVDYAGPMILKEGKRRNARNHKAYISIFVCFATKGVHIE